MNGKLFDTNLCDFVRHLDDEEILWLVQAPTLVPDLMGLTDHLPSCAECGDRVGRILLNDNPHIAQLASHRAPLVLAASDAEPESTEDSLVAFDQILIEGIQHEFLENSEGRVWLSGPVPESAKYLYLGQNRYDLKWNRARKEPEISGAGSIEIEEFVRNHESDPVTFPVHFAD